MVLGLKVKATSGSYSIASGAGSGGVSPDHLSQENNMIYKFLTGMLKWFSFLCIVAYMAIKFYQSLWTQLPSINK